MDKKSNIKFWNDTDLPRNRNFMIGGNKVIETYQQIPCAAKNNTIKHLQKKGQIVNKILNTPNTTNIKINSSDKSITSNVSEEIAEPSTSGQGIIFNVATQPQGIIPLKQRVPYDPIYTIQYNPIFLSEKEGEADFCQSEDYASATNDSENIYLDTNDGCIEKEMLQCNKILNESEPHTINVSYNENNKSASKSSTQIMEENSIFGEIIQNQHNIMKKLNFIMEFIMNEPKGEVGSINNVLMAKSNINVINHEYKFQEKSQLDKFDLRLRSDNDFLNAFENDWNNEQDIEVRPRSQIDSE